MHLGIMHSLTLFPLIVMLCYMIDNVFSLSQKVQFRIYMCYDNIYYAIRVKFLFYDWINQY